MRSRLLTRLDDAIAKTREPVALACLRAERAGFLGRQGQVALARSEIEGLQRQFALRPHAAVSGWIALAEGQIEQYARLGSAVAHDRFKRAHALAAAAGLQPLQALSAAWLSHAHYLCDERERMAERCAEAVRLAEPGHHGARWRAGLTVAVTLHYADRFDLAQPWYAAARLHALADGDEVAMSAMLYNQAGLRADQARQAAAFGDTCEAAAAGVCQASAAVLGIDSSLNFDAGIGLQSMDWLVPLMRAQLLVLQERFEEALAIIDRHQQRMDGVWRVRYQPGLAADRAWCLLQLQREVEARGDAEAAVQGLQDSQADADDQALAHARLAQLFEAWGEPVRAARHRGQAQQQRSAYRRHQQETLRLVLPVLGELRP